MQILLDIYNNCRLLLQQFGASYSGIYLAVILLLVTWVFIDDKSHILRLFRYALVSLVMILVLCVLKSFYPENQYLGNVDLYMIVPVILLNILLCLYLGLKMKFRQRVVIIFFACLILCEASVPFSLSLSNSFVRPDINGKISSETKQISDIVGESTVVLPSSLDNEYRELHMCGTQTVICLYDDGQSYLTNTNIEWNVFSLGVQNGSEYVVVRVINKLGETNVDAIEKNASATGYEVIDQVGVYAIAKKVQTS